MVDDNLNVEYKDLPDLALLLDQEKRFADINKWSPVWNIAKKVNWAYIESELDIENCFGKAGTQLSILGFIILNETDLFYQTLPPADWTKETKGYWTIIYDDRGKERISQFYNGLFYDEQAFINIQYYLPN